MKKVFRLIIISALLLGILIPVVDHFYQEEEKAAVTMAQESRDRTINELFKLAEEAYYEGNYSTAENYYQEIIELSPFNLESRRNLAVIYNDQNKLQAENKTRMQLTILSNQNQDYLDLAVNFYELNNQLASNYILENKVDEQLEQESLRYQKYYYLIKNDLDLDNLDKAEEYLMKITNLKVNQSEVYLLSAELNRKKDNFKQAFNNYQSAYEENRGQTYLFKNMAEMLELAGEEIEAYNYWQRTLSYGWFRDLAYQKINQYQDKYPQLKPDAEDQEEPEEINPFTLEASWREVEELKNQEENQLLRIGLQENNEHLLFQYSDPFSVVYDGKIIYRAEPRKNYLLEIEAGSIFIRTEEERLRLGSSDLEYQIYSSQQNSSFYVYNINYGQGYFWQGSGNRQYRGNMIIKGEGEEFTLINQVELTPYLVSVVPSEIYASWPEEALKAQAVAARSYTLSNLGRHSSDGYDLCSSVHCAAYNGIMSENERTTEAVLSTQGESAV
ncbi:MAG: SpoIID/LytB domain-containing protein, partial [Halanaerobium sp.]